MNKVLIITYYWPPASNPGVQRSLKFCKYLHEFGWKPYILTVKNGNPQSYDKSLLKDIPEGINVYRTKPREPFELYNRLTCKTGKSIFVGPVAMESTSLIKRLSMYIRANLFIPDARKGWNKFAKKAAKRIIKQEGIDAIVTTGPPHSTHLTGLYLKKRIGIPWLADLRDPWTNIYYNEYFPRTKKTCKKDKKLENEVLQTADHVTVVSPGLKKEFGARANDISVIYNGFDETDVFEKKQSKTNRFTLAFIGNFLPTENISNIWKAIAELKSEVMGFADYFRLCLTGNIDSGVIDALEKYTIADLAIVQSYVDHNEATKKMAAANMLLFIVPRTKNNKPIITGKLFEYIASRTPILSVGPLNGDASKILEETGRDKMAPFNGKNAIKMTLLKYYKKWLSSKHQVYKHEKADIGDYTRRVLTKRLSEILEEII